MRNLFSVGLWEIVWGLMLVGHLRSMRQVSRDMANEDVLYCICLFWDFFILENLKYHRYLYLRVLLKLIALSPSPAFP